MIELLVVLVIAAVLLAVALPSMNEFIARQRVVRVATELASDLRYARSEQMKSSTPMRIIFSNNTTKTCYFIHNFVAFSICSCARESRPYCTAYVEGSRVPTEYKVVDVPRSDQITVLPKTDTPSVLVFEATTGQAINAANLSIEIDSTRGGHLRVRTGASGQPSICSVSGHGARFPACPE